MKRTLSGEIIPFAPDAVVAVAVVDAFLTQIDRIDPLTLEPFHQYDVITSTHCPHTLTLTKHTFERLVRQNEGCPICRKALHG